MDWGSVHELGVENKIVLAGGHASPILEMIHKNKYPWLTAISGDGRIKYNQNKCIVLLDEGVLAGALDNKTKIDQELLALLTLSIKGEYANRTNPLIGTAGYWDDAALNPTNKKSVEMADLYNLEPDYVEGLVKFTKVINDLWLLFKQKRDEVAEGLQGYSQETIGMSLCVDDLMRFNIPIDPDWAKLKDTSTFVNNVDAMGMIKSMVEWSGNRMVELIDEWSVGGYPVISKKDWHGPVRSKLAKIL